MSNPLTPTTGTCIEDSDSIDPGGTLGSIDPGGTPGSTESSDGSGGLKNPLQVSSLEALITAILGAIVQIGSILLVLALVWTGFLFVFAQGNDEKLRSARQALFWTVIGGLILLGAQAIALVIKATVAEL